MAGSPVHSRVTAVLGPTNTGKTHLAIERMLGHHSGMIGFPLRLLARENYDRICRLRGAGAVALVTGEEKILPPSPRYYVCTVESMPVDRPVAFLAVDEIQLAADRERGHVFTDRLLRARGLAETMFLGADTIRGLMKRLVPEAEIIARPRFSRLTYAGPRKITRLPPRSAIVAFSAREVYAIAELVRSQRGGVAVVLGALSPRTRNAQVAMYQAGEVDYLVATDAIGMGLNMDIDHVVFAARRKFDGWRWRDLGVAELAQIAGRAGRHMNDGTFGTTAELGPFDAETVSAIEEHRFPPVKRLYWRSAALDFSSPGALLASLQVAPPTPELMRGDEAEDQQALALLAAQPDIALRARDRGALRLLWDVCQIPNFRNELGEGHAQLLARIYRFLVGPDRRIPADYAARQLARLDRIEGDIDMLMTRISHVRTWTYVAHRSDWLDEAETWQDRARAIEDRLSDALHQKLAQRFVDTRTAALVQRLRGGRDLVAAVKRGGQGESDEVVVEGQYVGELEGFHFRADPVAVGPDMRAVMTAARRALAPEMRRRVQRLAAAGDSALALDEQGRITWEGVAVASLRAGARALAPLVEPIAADLLDGPQRDAIRGRASAWLKAHLATELAALFAIESVVAGSAGKPLPLVGGAGRGILFQLAEGLGSVPRKAVEAQHAALAPAERKALARLGIRLGTESIYLPAMLRPRATRLKAILWAAKAGQPIPFLAPPGRVSLVVDPAVPAGFFEVLGYRVLGPRALRIDMLERLAQHVRGLAKAGPFGVDAEMLSLAGCRPEETAAVLSALGYRRQGEGSAARFRRSRPKAPPLVAPPRDGSPFARLKTDWPTRS